MSNGTAATVSSAGGGIAFLRRQFELRVDPLYEAPMKPPVRKRPSSFIDPKAIKTTAVDSSSNVRPEHVQPKPRDATSLSELAASDPGHVPSTSSFSFSSSSSALTSSSKTTVDAAAGVDLASSKDANNRQMEEIEDIRGEVASKETMSHSHDLELTPTPQLHRSDVNTSKDINDCSAKLTEAEMNDKHETKNTSSANDGSKETNINTNCLNSNAGEFSHASTSACNPAETESTNGVLKTGLRRGKDYDADRRLPEEILPPAQMSPNSKTYLSSSNAAPKKTWMPVTRSMENLCSDSAGTPTKESNTFCENKPNNVLLSAKAKAADAVTTSQSLDRSTSLATKAKPPVRAKKPPPPPVPKKNVKFAQVSKSHRPIVDDGAKEDANTSTKLSSEEGNSSSPSSETTAGSEGGVDESQGSQLRRSATTSTKVTRPTSFFPPMQQSPAIRRAVESAVDYDRYKSLPTLSQGDSPVCNRKDTMFPSNRQKLRPQVLTAESGHAGGTAAITPEIYQRSSIGDFQMLLASPMSLGNRTPPGIDSVIATPEEHLTDHRPSSASSNCPPPTTINSDTSHSTRVTPDTLLPTPSSELETFDISSAAAEQQVSGSNQLSEMSDADSFLDDTFEFLSCDAQSIEDESNIISPLKLWTDTWCKGLTKNQNEIHLQTSTNDSKINHSQKGIEISTKDGINVQDNMEKSKLKTTAKKEEDKQRTTEVKQDLKRRGSSANAVDRKAPENAKDAADTIERPKLFGVVLRTNSNCSLARRSTIVSAIPNNSATTASSPSSSFPSSSAAASATSVRDRRSTAIVRTPSDTRSLSRLSSLTSLTILPSNRPAGKVPGKYIGGKPSIILDGTSSVLQQDKKTADIETELNAIDRAFDFLDLDDSGA